VATSAARIVRRDNLPQAIERGPLPSIYRRLIAFEHFSNLAFCVPVPKQQQDHPPQMLGKPGYYFVQLPLDFLRSRGWLGARPAGRIELPIVIALGAGNIQPFAESPLASVRRMEGCVDPAQYDGFGGLSLGRTRIAQRCYHRERGDLLNFPMPVVGRPVWWDRPGSQAA
jgi:hypothetical protein